MRAFFAKRCLVICFFCVLPLLSGLGALNWMSSQATSGAPPVAQTGAPALGDFPAEKDCTACHTGTVNTGEATVARSAAPASYLPNQEIQLTLSAHQSGQNRFGFQATALDAQGQMVGEFLLTDPERTQLGAATDAPFTGRNYILNTQAGSAPSQPNTGSWTFKWKAPPQRVGRVTIYFALTAANDDGTVAGDAVYTNRLTLDPDLPALATVSAASYLPNAAVAPESILASFGESLADNAESSTTLPLPYELDGLRIGIRDSNGTERAAPLFFVGPNQLNYLIPTGTALGRATVTVRRDSDTLAAGALNVETVAPGLFTANASGKGVAAAIILRVKANGQQSFEPVARWSTATSRFEGAPIELGQEGEQVFLLLFGTGFRAHNTLADVTCTIGGQNAEVLFTGAQGDLAGLDQANIRLPRSLAGRGSVNALLGFGSATANTVSIHVK